MLTHTSGEVVDLHVSLPVVPLMSDDQCTLHGDLLDPPEVGSHVYFARPAQLASLKLA